MSARTCQSHQLKRAGCWQRNAISFGDNSRGNEGMKDIVGEDGMGTGRVGSGSVGDAMPMCRTAISYLPGLCRPAWLSTTGRPSIGGREEGEEGREFNGTASTVKVALAVCAVACVVNGMN